MVGWKYNDCKRLGWTHRPHPAKTHSARGATALSSGFQINRLTTPSSAGSYRADALATGTPASISRRLWKFAAVFSGAIGGFLPSCTVRARGSL